MEDKKLPVYETPSIATYTEELILEELGPALAQVGQSGGGSSGGQTG